MRSPADERCPRCERRLVPVFAVEGERRTVVALTCPEPYCDHMQMVPRAEASERDPWRQAR